MSLLKLAAVSVIGISLCIPAQAVDLDLSVTARAEAGLDPATREFIKSLPDTWRPQIAKIVDDTLTRADTSVKLYLVEIDKLLTNKIQELQCAVVGTQKQVVDDIASRLPWVNKASPMVDLRQNIADEEAKFRSTTSPTSIKDVLNDLSLKASIIICQNFAVATARADAKKIVDTNSSRWLVWNRVASFPCSQIDKCIGPYRDALAEIISKSDPRDVEYAAAAASLQKFNAPKPASWWQASLPFAEYEKALSELFRIENSVGAAKTIREARAVKRMGVGISTSEKARDGLNAVRSGQQFTTLHLGGSFGSVRMPFIPSQSPRECTKEWVKLSALLEPVRTQSKAARAVYQDALAIAPILNEEITKKTADLNAYDAKVASAAAFCS